MSVEDADDRAGSQRDPRVYLAAERTLLAWLRTGLAMMGFGFVVARFGLFLREIAAIDAQAPAQNAHLSLWGGTALVAMGVTVNIIAAVGHAQFINRFNLGLPLRARPVSMGVIVALILALLGIVACVYLITTR